MASEALEAAPPLTRRLLLATVFAVATCTLVYELLAGAVSSYLLGSSILQFSLVVGAFFFALGVGALLSRRVKGDALRTFLLLEVGVALLGGSSAGILFACFPYPGAYTPVLLGLCCGIGLLSGLEVPLVIRLLRERGETLERTAASVMTADYLGGLAGSLAFPFLILPQLGLVRGALVVGILNIAVVWVGLIGLRAELSRPRGLWALTVGVTLALCGGLIASPQLVSIAEERSLPDEILFAGDTEQQRVVVTRFRDDVRVFTAGQLRFSTRDAHRYAEALVHPALSSVGRPERVLLLGGDDGLVAAECLEYPALRQLDVHTLDPGLSELFRPGGPLADVSGGAFADPRVRLLSGDPFEVLRASTETYDAILFDLPEPSTEAWARCASVELYTLAASRLTPEGILAVQCSSPWWVPDVFWCMVATLEAADLRVHPYHVVVPSLGECGFALASRTPIRPSPPKVPTRFLDAPTLQRAAVFPPDIARRPVDANRLDAPVVLRYYRDALAKLR